MSTILKRLLKNWGVKIIELYRVGSANASSAQRRLQKPDLFCVAGFIGGTFCKWCNKVTLLSKASSSNSNIFQNLQTGISKISVVTTSLQNFKLKLLFRQIWNFRQVFFSFFHFLADLNNAEVLINSLFLSFANKTKQNKNFNLACLRNAKEKWERETLKIAPNKLSPLSF